MNPIRLIPPVVLVLAVTACASTSAESTWSGTVDTLATGTIVVHNPPIDESEAGPITVTEELRIGSLDSDGPDMFGQLYDIEVDEDGNIYLLEAQAEEIRVFNPTGEHVRTIGRSGAGPGEIGNASGMDMAPDGNLWVMDTGNSRITVFSPEGELIETVIQQGGYVTFPWPGGFFDSTTVTNIARVMDDSGELVPVLLGTDLDHNPTDTLPIPTYNGEENFFELVSDRGRMRSTVPYSGGLTWRMDGAGHFWTSETGDYRIRKSNRAGDTLLVVEMEVPTVPVTDEDIEEAVEGLKWFTDQGGKIEYDKFPDIKPALTSMYVSPDGYLFVRPVLEDEEVEAQTLDIFAPDGRFVDRVNFGSRVTPRYSVLRGNSFYTISFDDLEVPYVVKFRLAGLPERASASGEG